MMMDPKTSNIKTNLVLFGGDDQPLISVVLLGCPKIAWRVNLPAYSE
jgi:hypothetical protein